MISMLNNYVNKNCNNDCNSSIKWNQWILIGFTMFISMMLLLVPLIVIFVSAFSEGLKIVIVNLINQDMIHATFLTVIIALFTVPINVFFGVLMAWLVTRFKFYGRQLLYILVNIPIAVSPVIVGLLYLLLYANNNAIASWLDLHNIQIIFTWVGLVLVTIFVTCPFVVHELVPMMVNQGRQEDEAAILLGASGWMMFRYVTFPNIRWALLYGAILTNSRAIGEFGAVSIVSGLIRGETYTVSLYVELLYQDYNTVGAFVAASLLACISILMLFIKHYLQSRLKRNN
ncbi:thiosulfate permease W protein (ABC superfamily, membrane) [Candidatus Blochmanniella pennsylvanica str. BPEN]|uniref:Thiosulfate permease W protein (ABC superfamily, membrane) n=1 Tax=Blochmanniella pennsylvanica (strain BPEN) TaxID=291272 RepID=Q492G2_BLOPB|nr:sulfate ABC transporter permease subunit [Candidatus Blochmannia pennsylvanicus]AAZ41139.1 thiosulfate permease W protein (ABC superfamily, membrane) [Candidatus Blochmannia pennsylvanicus str. BPEN]